MTFTAEQESRIRAIIREELKPARMEVEVSPPADVYMRPCDKYEAIKQDLIAHYKSGASLLECGRKFKLGSPTVRKVLNGWGVEIRNPGSGKCGSDGIDKRIPAIMSMRRAGATLQEIGDHFGITRERVRQLVVKAGKAKDFKERPPTAEEIAAMEEYKAGGSLDLCAARMGVGHVTARKRLIENGYQIRPSRKKLKQKAEREQLAAQIASRYKAGESPSDIAKAFGFKNSSQIYRYIAIAGVRPDRMVSA